MWRLFLLGCMCLTALAFDSPSPKIDEMCVNTDVSNRYAKTTIKTVIRNFDKEAQQTYYQVILPNSAFVSGLTMEIGGQNYTALIKSKQEAEREYQDAVTIGAGAGFVSVRDADKIGISLNIEPESKVIFYLNYEELLRRKKCYEVKINIFPKQLVPNLKVQVNIHEEKPIKDLKVPVIRSGNDLRDLSTDLDPRPMIKKIDPKTVTVIFNPSLEMQKQMASALNIPQEEGINGQFVVQYDVERDYRGGDVFTKDGYFVHYFAPDLLKPLPKHILFVLDTSGSMYGKKIAQLKLAMLKIVDDLKPGDFFNVIEFKDYVKMWNANGIFKSYDARYPEKSVYPDAVPVNQQTITKAKEFIQKRMAASGGTNIYDALHVALKIVKMHREKNKKLQPLIVFLTDGKPEHGKIRKTSEITKLISRENDNIPIFTLSFGSNADKGFLHMLSLRNYGSSKHIYDADDAALQLQDFYGEISTPVLSHIEFKYSKVASSKSKIKFPNYFGGSELVICGTMTEDLVERLVPKVSGWSVDGQQEYTASLAQTSNSIERLCAYLTIQQMLQDRTIAENPKEIEDEALAVALKYSFVTPLTSLVVVNPISQILVPLEPTDIEYLINKRFGEDDAVPVEGEELTVFEPVINELNSSLPWFKDIYNAENETLTLSKGTYKVGSLANVTETGACENAPFTKKGNCKLIYSCPKMYTLINSKLKQYESHFCVIEKEYAGVCCPTSFPENVWM